MYITLFNIKESKGIGSKIISNFTNESLVPVVEGTDRFGLNVAKVINVFEEEGQLVAELSNDVHMVDGSFESIVYSVNRTGGLRHIGIVRSGGDFAFEGNKSTDDYRVYTVEAAGGISVNRKGVSKANSLISQGKVDRNSDWSFSAEDGNKILGKDNWGQYGRWFLGVRLGTNPKSKDHYVYPFGKNEKIYRRGVIAAKSRSAQQNHTAVNIVATRLLNKIDKVK